MKDRNLWLCVAGLVLLAAVAFAAAPLHKQVVANVGDFETVCELSDSLMCKDSVILIGSDSCSMVLAVTGVACLDAGDKLYLGFGTTAAGTTADLDTFRLQMPRPVDNGKVWMPFSFHYAVNKVAAVTDTLYFFAAAGGSGSTEAVQLKDVVLVGTVSDTP